MFIGQGPYGLSEMKQEGQAQFRSLMSRKSSKFNPDQKEMELPSEYRNFLDKFTASVLVGFGTTWSPEDHKIVEIVKVMKAMSDIGFVISLQKQWSSYSIVKDADLPNVLIKNFVP